MLTVKHFMPLVIMLTMPGVTLLQESNELLSFLTATSAPLNDESTEKVSPGDEQTSESKEQAANVSPPPSFGSNNESFSVDALFLPTSWQNLAEPINSIVKFTMRVPVYIVGWVLGQNAEMLGLQMMSIGNALLKFGAESFGYGLKDYGLSVMALGTTIKEWFVNNNIPPELIHLLKADNASYQWWHAFGESYLKVREENEKLYSSSF